MILSDNVVVSLGSVLRERGEEGSSHRGDRLLEGHAEAIIEGLGAHNTISLGIHYKATEA